MNKGKVVLAVISVVLLVVLAVSSCQTALEMKKAREAREYPTSEAGQKAARLDALRQDIERMRRENDAMRNR